MLSSIVSFANTEVVDIMKSRVDIISLDMTERYDVVRKVITEHGFSRIPVYEESIDHITGILYVKDLIPHIGAEDDFEWQKLLRKPNFVPEHKKISDLMEEMQTEKVHMAIVVDEYASTLGLVSMEDIVEEVVGEILDDSDDDEKFFIRIDKNNYLFDGKTHIGDFERALSLDEEAFSDVKGEAETLAGLMLEVNRDFLKKGDHLMIHNIKFTVYAIEGRRIDKIKVTLINSEK